MVSFATTFTGGVLAAIVVLSLITVASVAVAAIVCVKLRRKGTVIAYKRKTQAFMSTNKMAVLMTKLRNIKFQACKNKSHRADRYYTGD